jgi:oligoribonuclease NrnB/cAMP/cGMP phosphodiesterase (DHH superfamily)
METVCIYHAECVDGAASAAVVRHRYPDAGLYATRHGDSAPTDLQGKRVFIVDFGFDAQTMNAIKEQSAELHWFDHHKTALPTSEELGCGIIDLNESGATLTWKQLYPGKAVPRILQYVRDKDIWVWELPDSREVSHAIRETEGILDPASATWSHLLEGISDSEWKELIERGRRSRRTLQEKFEKAARKGFEVELKGHRTLAVNWTDDASEIGEHIYRDLGYPVALMFSYNGQEWTFSLRSATVDVADIAIQFDGGGHAGAAGFRTPTLDWLFKARCR